MTRTFLYDPDNPRRESVLTFMCEAIRSAGAKRAITVKEPTRNLESNAAMWAALGEIARQVQWPVDGKMQHLPADDWKDILTASLKREQRVAQGVDGGFVMLGSRTSKMTQRQMGELIELIHAFGAERGVVFAEPVRDAA